MALLSGARNAKDSQLAQRIYDRMKQLFPDCINPMVPAVVLLANVYASSGDTEKASNIRAVLNRSGAKKKVGLTWTSVSQKIYVSIDRLLL